MKHTIFVTVEEFLNNGGILNNGRSIYNEDFKEIGWFDSSIQICSAPAIVVTNSSRSFQFLTNLVFVEIICSPIYI